MPRFAPLEGIRVLDLSKVLAGPQCAQYLGELGADVIKVEPAQGDDTRAWPPFEQGVGTIFLSANRNKRGVALDLKSDEGRAVCRRLAERADVVLESFGPGVAARLGVDHESLSAINPRLVYCSISGYGSVGPMREGKGYDVILQAFSGMLSMTGEPGGPPSRSPFSPVDQGTGMHAVIGILGALLQRASTGRGAKVEASLFDTADAPLILGVANDALWVAFCRVAGAPGLATRPGFEKKAERVARRAETVAEDIDGLRRRGVVVAPPAGA